MRQYRDDLEGSDLVGFGLNLGQRSSRGTSHGAGLSGVAWPLLSAILCESMSVTDSQNHRHKRVNSDESQGLG